MPDSPKSEKIRFWPLLALILGVDLMLTFLYTVIIPGLSANGWSDALCASAFVLAIGSAIPMLLDAGRGFSMAGKMSGSKQEQHEAYSRERTLREKGMRITFVLALGTILIGLLSLLMSLF